MTSSEADLLPTQFIVSLLRRVLVRMVMATVVLTSLLALIGWFAAGGQGLWSAGIAGLLGLFFAASTVLLLQLTIGRDQSLMMAVVLGGWLLKMIVLGGAVLILRQYDFFHPQLLGVGVILVALTSLVLEVHLLMTTRVPRVVPIADAPAGHESDNS